MKMKKLLAAAVALMVSFGAVASDPPKREFRSIWMAAMGIDWPHGSAVGNQRLAKEQLINYIENFKRHNFTGICLQIRPLADALYVSTLEPWSASVSGTRGVDPGWDPLQFAIEECHKRGMELYAWINPFRINNTGSTYTTDFDLEWREKGWELKSGKWTIFNIAIPEARQHCLDVIKEIYTNYALDGMLFDDYFYPGDKLTETSAAGDYQLWKDSNSGLTIANWRRRNVNEFVKELYDMVQQDRPDMHFGIGPAGTAGASSAQHGVKPPTAGYDWQYNDIYADPLAWLDDGSIDFIAPQIYWARNNSSSPFTPIAEWWAYVADHFGRHNYISEASYRVNESSFGGNNENGWNEFVAQIEIGRANAKDGAPGQIYYSAKQFDGPDFSGLGDWLEKYCYQRPALIPPLTWKEHVTYDAPAGGAYDGKNVSWQAVKGPRENTIMRYSLYAVPMATPLEEAMAANGDGIDGRYLVDVSYATTYEMPEEVRLDHWYAVCVYDGYGFEHKPALVNYPSEMSGATTQLTPAADAVAAWDCELTWTPVEGARYIVEVATDAKMSNIIFTARDLAESKAVFDLSDLSNNTRLYWRVAVCEPGKLYFYTEPRLMYSPTRVAAQKAELTAPAEGATFDAGSLTLKWNAVPDAERYFVQIADNMDYWNKGFERTVLATSVAAPATELTVDYGTIGSSSFSWRVVTSGRRVNESVSDTHTFAVAGLENGAIEKGYTPKTDLTTGFAGDAQVTGLWFRTAGDDNCPLVFEGEGAFNHSMVATPAFVFVTGRSENKSTAESYLRQFDAHTGELVRDIKLAKAENVANLPCNQVVKDSRNDIYVIDQSSSVRTRPIHINKVDLATGALTEVATLKGTTPTSMRVDYAAVRGDISSGSFFVYAVISNKATIIRWDVEDFEVADTHTFTTTSFAGTASNFGLAPRLWPVSDELVWIDPANAPAALYNVLTGEIVTDITRLHPEAASWATANNGIASLQTLGRTIVALSTGNTAESGCRVTLVPVDGTPEAPVAADTDAAPLHLPAAAMGTLDQANGSAVVDVVNLDGQRHLVYVYSPGNGLAAYHVAKMSSVSDIEQDSTLGITTDGLTIVLGSPAADVRLYDTRGALVARAGNAATIEAPAAGIYVVSADSLTATVVVR